MSISLPRTARRFALGVVVVVALYLTLDALIPYGVQLLPVRVPDSVSDQKPLVVTVDKTAIAIPHALPIAERVSDSVAGRKLAAAWRLGEMLGVASQASHYAAQTKSEAQAKMAAAILRKATEPAAQLGIASPKPLTGRTLWAAGQLTERIEADETGQAKLIGMSTSVRHRHLFLAGMHAGYHAHVLITNPAADGKIAIRFVEAHLRAASVPQQHWQALLRQTASTPEGRRAQYVQAIRHLEKVLANAR